MIFPSIHDYLDGVLRNSEISTRPSVNPDGGKSDQTGNKSQFSQVRNHLLFFFNKLPINLSFWIKYVVSVQIMAHFESRASSDERRRYCRRIERAARYGEHIVLFATRVRSDRRREEEERTHLTYSKKCQLRKEDGKKKRYSNIFRLEVYFQMFGGMASSPIIPLGRIGTPEDIAKVISLFIFPTKMDMIDHRISRWSLTIGDSHW